MKLPHLSHHLWYADWITQRTIPRHRPEFVYLDVYDGCDGSCLFCPVAGTKGKPINDGLFKHIVEEMSRWGVRELSLSTNSEPTLHPDLPRLVREGVGAGLEVYFSTGGHHLDAYLAKELILAKVAGIAVSLESISGNLNQIPSSWDISLAGMKELLRARGNVPFPRLTILLPLPSDLPIDKKNELSTIIQSKLPIQPDALLALHRHDWHRLYPGAQTFQNSTHFPCQHPWRGLYLNSSGQIITCYFDPQHLQVVAEIGGNSLPEVWRSQAMQELRFSHQHHSFTRFPLCAHCLLPDRSHPFNYLVRALSEQWRFGRHKSTKLQWYY